MPAASSQPVVLDIVEQHAHEAAFNWVRRDEAAHSPAYDLLELCELDDRLCCHLDGLREAAGAGWEACSELLEAREPGSVFAGALLAIERSDWEAFADLLDQASEADALRELTSALGWTPFDQLGVVLRGMSVADVPALQRLGIATHAVHRRDPGLALAQATQSIDPGLRARAFRAVGELRRSDLRAALTSGYEAEEEGCRFWSAWSATLLGDRDAHEVLARLAETSEAYGKRACELLVRSASPMAARHTIELLAARNDLGLRHAIFGAGALGDPDLVPWLLTFLEDESHARAAAWSLSMMLNLHLAGARPPSGFVGGPDDDPRAEDISSDRDEDLPWPEPERVLGWWKERSSHFAPRTRHLLGRPIEPGWLQHVLGNANQLARASAALELFLLRRGETLFEVRAPGFEQLASLGRV